MSTSRTRKKSNRPRSVEDKSSQLIDYVETLAALNEQHPICDSDPLPKVEPKFETLATLNEQLLICISDPLPKVEPITVETKSEKTLDEKLGEVSANVELQLEQFLLNLDLRLQDLLAQLQNNLPCTSCSQMSNDATEIESEESDDNSSENFASDETDSLLSEWDRRKQQMLAEHGMSGDEIAEQTTTVKPKSKKSASKKAQAKSKSAPSAEQADDRFPPRLGGCEEGHALEALHDSIAQLDKIDSAEIETLKEQLTSKLRDAEVELSINRAKLSQQWAALEQKQCEMAQRESSLKSKYGNLTEATKKAGLLDRLSRHLTRRKDDC